MAENKTYEAKYHIQHGVTHGFGLVYPDESVEKCVFDASDAIGGIRKAVEEARNFARNYISHPSGKTTVTLQELCEKNGGVIDVRAEIEKHLGERFPLVKDLLFPDGTHYATECSWIEHALAIERTTNIAIDKMTKK